METFVQKVPMIANCEVIPLPTKMNSSTKKFMMIDACLPHSYNEIKEYLKQKGISVQQIEYFFLTHSHSDHVGNLAELRKENPKMKVICHEIAIPCLKVGSCRATMEDLMKSLPPHIIAMFAPNDQAFDALCAFPKVEVGPEFGDIIISPSKNCKIDPETKLQYFDLEAITGISAKVFLTPGHSVDGIGLLLNDKSVFFVGDVIGAKENPMATAPFMLSLFSTKEILYNTWKGLANSGAKIFVLGHGEPVDGEEFKNYVCNAKLE